LAAVAAAKDISLGKLEVEVRIDQGEKGGDIHTVLYLDKDLSEREVRILFNSARHCEVGKFLEGPIHFQYKLEEGS